MTEVVVRSASMRNILVFLITGALFSGCDQGSDSEEPNHCEKQFDTGLSVFSVGSVFANSKVILNDSAPEVGAQSASEDIGLFEQGRRFSVIVRKDCPTNRRGYFSRLVNYTAAATSQHSGNVRLPEKLSRPTLVRLAEQDHCLVGLGEYVPMSLREEDSYLSEQAHLSATHSEEAQALLSEAGFASKKRTVVAIVDSGVDIDHEDLRENLWTNGRETSNGRDDDGNGLVDDVYGYNFASRRGDPRPEAWSGMSSGGEAHGTHVAGLAAARAGNGVGVFSFAGESVSIMSLNVFGRSAGANPEVIENAVRYAADKGAKVINLSLGGCGYSATMEESFRYALSRGAVLVVAAGNDDAELSADPSDGCGGRKVFDSPASFAAKYEGVVAVGSSDARLNNAKSEFSNYGIDVVSLFAPGSENSMARHGLLSTVPGDGYERFEGTSMASPFVGSALVFVFNYLATYGRDANPALVERVLLHGSAANSALAPYVDGGRTLDFLKLSQTLARYFGPDSKESFPEKPSGDCL